MQDWCTQSAVDGVTRADVNDLATVWIDRTAKRNALTLEMLRGIAQAVVDADANPEIHAVVLRGRDQVFSAGLDLTALAQGQQVDHAFIDQLQQVFHTIEDASIPVIAAVEGYCYGAGLQLALAAHMRVASLDARLAVAERRLALVPDLGGTIRLPRLVGLGRATELCATGRDVEADEALGIGLVDMMWPTLDDPDAQAWLEQFVDAPKSVGRSIALCRENLSRNRADASRAEAEAQLASFSDPAFAAAMAGS